MISITTIHKIFRLFVIDDEIADMEQYIVDCVQASANNPGTTLRDRNGGLQDIIKALHVLEKMYWDMKVGTPAKYLKPTSVLASADIEVLIDTPYQYKRTHKGAWRDELSLGPISASSCRIQGL